MKVLYILKSEPDELTESLLEAHADDEVETVRLYDGEINWADVVDQIFSHDKVICWW